MMPRVFQAPEQECETPTAVRKADAKSTRQASNAPLTISATKESWVPRACPLSMASCISAFAPVRTYSHGWTSTAAPSPAQWWRKVTIPASSRFLLPTMVPDLNAEMPSLHAPASSLPSCVNILQGTWQKDFNLPFPRLQSSSAASLNNCAQSNACSTGRS